MTEEGHFGDLEGAVMVGPKELSYPRPGSAMPDGMSRQLCASAAYRTTRPSELAHHVNR